MSEKTKLVKLYPQSKRNGWVLRTYTVTGGKNPIRFKGISGWYEVAQSLAEQLALVPQQDRYPISRNGARAFLIARDEDHAKELDAEVAEILKEKDEEAKGTASTPIRVHRPGSKTTATAEGGEDKPAPRRRRGRSTTAE